MVAQYMYIVLFKIYDLVAIEYELMFATILEDALGVRCHTFGGLRKRLIKIDLRAA